RDLLDKGTDARARLARLVFAGLQGGTIDELKARFDPIQNESESLENALSATKISLLDGVSVPVTIDQIQRALPARAALIELVAFRPYDPRAKTERAEWGARTFAAYVLRPGGAPIGIELGTE